ncbi:DUF2202 domain-containing protein [Thalassovita aquimarina]|uniref:DUF2202 domain-containing protein n=1 Tax=Thalassovita aquimarina TaxID=2785917 RepID=UPI00356291DF
MYQYQYSKEFAGSAGRQGESSSESVTVAENGGTTVEQLFAGKKGGTGFWTGETDAQTVTITYSDEAISELLFMIEEEKLAGDIYEAFYDLYGMKIFANVAASESQHFDALVDLAESIGLDVDEFIYEPSGTFVDEELQQLYDTLIAQGSVSATDALEVGVAIEEKDMIDIAEAADAVEGTALASIYENLLAGSANHLEAFQDVLL